MTFEEAEKFRWNPFDVTKVRLLSVELFNDTAFSTDIIHHQMRRKKQDPSISQEELSKTTLSLNQASQKP
jgi:hypothetical protein